MEASNRWRLLESQTPAHDVAALRRKVNHRTPPTHTFNCPIISIIIKDIYIAQVLKGHKCAMSAEIAV